MSKSLGQRIKVCMMTTVHEPFDTRIFRKEAQSLKDAGFEVVLIAKHEKSETIDGISISGLPRPRSRFDRIFLLTWRVFFLALRKKADMYHFHDPELILIGILLKIFTKAKVIYDVHEEFPMEILSKEWLPSFSRKWVSRGVGWIEKVASNVFDAVIAATPNIASHFPDKKVTVIQNFPRLDEIGPETNIEFRNRPNRITYVGDIREVRGACEMVQAMELLPDIMNVKLYLAGRFNPPTLEMKLKNLPGWKHVEFLGWRTKKQVTKLFNTSRAGLVLLHPLPNHINALPNKLFEYMAAGLPVIASNFPLWRKIIEDNKCGILVNPKDTRSIANAIRYIIEHPEDSKKMGMRGRETVEKKYRWEIEEDKLVSLYHNLLGV